MQENILFREGERYYLASYGAVLAPTPHPILKNSQTALSALVYWVRDFLCQPNRQLGRGGNVCPYTAPALKRSTLWFTAITDKELNKDKMLETIDFYRQWFSELEPTAQNQSIFKSIIIAFPNITKEEAPKYIDDIQATLKGDFVKNGLMIGQFHESCPEAGLHNPEFRPLQSPVPLLAIRNMVRTDIPFLAHDDEFMKAYHKIFMQQEPSRL